MLKKTEDLLTDEIDKTIELFKACPKFFNDNVWRCYSACKRIVYDMEMNGTIPYACDLYDKYIDYITEKLEI